VPKKIFLITGLPRSRTAWLSCFLSIGVVFCYHDLTARTHGPRDFVEKVLSTPAECVGVSDSGLLLCLDEVLLEFEKQGAAPIVLLVKRPIEDAKPAFEKACGNAPGASAVIDRVCARLEAAPYQSVAFNKLDSSLQLIWEFCTGGAHKFPEYHAARMLTLNVQVKPHIMEHAAKTGEVLSC